MKGRFTDERSETGETLIEVLLSLALLGLVVVAILGGLATTVLGSAVHRQQANGNTVLVRAVEALKTPTVTRIQCAAATDATYLLAARTALPAGWAASTLTIESIKYENVTSVAGAAHVSFDTACNDTGTSGLTLQQITLRLDVPGDRVTSRVTFIKGDA